MGLEYTVTAGFCASCENAGEARTANISATASTQDIPGRSIVISPLQVQGYSGSRPVQRISWKRDNFLICIKLNRKRGRGLDAPTDCAQRLFRLLALGDIVHQHDLGAPSFEIEDMGRNLDSNERTVFLAARPDTGSIDIPFADMGDKPSSWRSQPRGSRTDAAEPWFYSPRFPHVTKNKGLAL